MEEAEKISSRFFKAGKHSSVMFDLAEETLNQVTLFISDPVTSSGIHRIGARRNNRLHAALFKPLDKRIESYPLSAMSFSTGMERTQFSACPISDA
jgi:hypothetical protein